MRDVRAELGSRELFPDLEARAYLNHAAMSPLSLPVQEAARVCMRDFARKGLGAYFIWADQRHRLKEKLAVLLGSAAEDIALVPSTTEGLSKLALCFPWERGDRVVVFSGEFPTNVTPWQQAAAAFDLDLVMLDAWAYLEDEASALTRLERELEQGVRVVAVSAVQFQTGYRMPLTEMVTRCHDAGTEIVVDAIQALGAVPFDVRALGIDYLVCGSYKWMMSMDGLGFVYAPPERAAALRPYVAGWLSHESPVSFLLEGPGHLRYDRPIRRSLDFLEGGSAATAARAALEASVDILLELTPAAIFEHVSAYLDALEPVLVELGFTSLRSSRPERRSGIGGFLPPEGVSAVSLQSSLDELGVSCAAPDGVLRFAPHWPNGLEEIDHVVASVEASLTSVRKGC